MNEEERIIENSELMRDQVFQFLYRLRDEGKVNMLGATTRIMQEFNLAREDARLLLIEWVESFDD